MCADACVCVAAGPAIYETKLQSMMLASAPDGHSDADAYVSNKYSMFAFPFGVRLSRDPVPTEFHSFVLTGEDGSKRYGHCCTRYRPMTNKQRLGVIRLQVCGCRFRVWPWRHTRRCSPAVAHAAARGENDAQP